MLCLGSGVERIGLIRFHYSPLNQGFVCPVSYPRSLLSVFRVFLPGSLRLRSVILCARFPSWFVSWLFCFSTSWRDTELGFITPTTGKCTSLHLLFEQKTLRGSSRTDFLDACQSTTTAEPTDDAAHIALLPAAAGQAKHRWRSSVIYHSSSSVHST